MMRRFDIGYLHFRVVKAKGPLGALGVDQYDCLWYSLRMLVAPQSPLHHVPLSVSTPILPEFRPSDLARCPVREHCILGRSGGASPTDERHQADGAKKIEDVAPKLAISGPPTWRSLPHAYYR